MADEHDRKTSLNRRAVLTTAIAGAAVATTAGAKAEGTGTQIVVDLGGITLPKDIAAKLEHDIRNAVLAAVTKAAPHTKFRSGTLPPGARGIVLVAVSPRP